MYDIIIIGCGPAGMTSAIYALRANKKVLILERETIGGLITSSPLVENYPGFKGISGMQLASNLYDQVIDLGGDIELEEVEEIIDGAVKTVITDSNRYNTKSVIIATGSKPRLLGLETEDKFIGNGISFCVACDGAFYKDKRVAVVGGGNSAVTTALTLSSLCTKVYLVQKMDKLTAESTLINKLKSKDNVEIIYNAELSEYLGDEELTGIRLSNNQIIDIDGVFLSIGQIPNNDFIKDLVTLDNSKYIISNDEVDTNVKGIFVAGDCREKKYRQLTTTVSDGTVAALHAIDYIENL